jgi:hypothetical protein
VTWITGPSCTATEISPDGFHATAGAFYVYAYGDATFEITEHLALSTPKLSASSCLAAETILPVSNAGAIAFGSGDGVNPCTGVSEPNNPPVAVCQDLNLVADGSCVASGSVDNGSTDPDGDPITLSQSPPGPYPVGTTTVTLTVTDDNDATSECTAEVNVVGPYDVTGNVLASCPSADTPLYGVQVDVFDGSGALVGNDMTDADGAYDIDLVGLGGDHTVTVVTPLGYTTSVEEVAVTLGCGTTTVVDFSFDCQTALGESRGSGFWKHQIGVALGGTGHADIDLATLCGYLDLVAARFNSNAINQVIIYEPPVSVLCADKLDVAKDLLNLRGRVGMTARAKQQLMGLLLNAAAGFSILGEVVSDDGATLSQAITYCDNLIDDPAGDHETAKNIAEAINRGESVVAGVIPLGTPTIAYSQPEEMVLRRFALSQNHPNPFTSRTAIQLELPSPSGYTLGIYDVTGKLVRRFVGSGEGQISIAWDGTDDTGLSVAPGVYFYHVEAGQFAKTKRMLLLR